MMFNHDTPNTESQSQFNAGFALAEAIQRCIEDGNAASMMLSMDGIRSWWLQLENVYRFISPRIKTPELRKRIEVVRVEHVPMSLRSSNQQMIVSFYRRKLTMYQIELEFMRDRLGLGFKQGDDPGTAILRG